MTHGKHMRERAQGQATNLKRGSDMIPKMISGIDVQLLPNDADIGIKANGYYGAANVSFDGQRDATSTT